MLPPIFIANPLLNWTTYWPIPGAPIKSVTQGKNGQVTFVGNNVAYWRTATGPDRFGYTLNDGTTGFILVSYDPRGRQLKPG